MRSQRRIDIHLAVAAEGQVFADLGDKLGNPGFGGNARLGESETARFLDGCRFSSQKELAEAGDKRGEILVTGDKISFGIYLVDNSSVSIGHDGNDALLRRLTSPLGGGHLPLLAKIFDGKGHVAVGLQ